MTSEPDSAFSLAWDVATDRRFATGTRTITASDIDAFAALTGDNHPVHTDEVWAEAGMFGGRIAHGLLALSCAVGLVPLDPKQVVALRRADATFKAPVRPGDSIHVEADVTGAVPIDEEHALVTCRWRVLKANGETAIRVSVDLLCQLARPQDSRLDQVFSDMPSGVIPL